jgi:type IV pilus assembly protein PilB
VKKDHYTRLGRRLLNKGIVSEEILAKALTLQSREPKPVRRKLQDVLVRDFKIDRHLIFREIAELYAFQQIDLGHEKIDKDRIDFIRDIIYELPDDIQQQFVNKKLLPFKWHDFKRNVLVLITHDPTDEEIHRLVSHLDCQHYEIAYTRLEDVEELIREVFYSRNEFLQQIAESIQSVEILDDESDTIDEEALDAEINRSMLTNLVEGMLVEATRRGASDIHIIPREGNVTELFFRIDGKLQHWYTQTDIKPEAIAAVVKDRSLNVDRFDRAIAQDGYIQRKIDGFYIRFRVSVIPIVGAEFDRRFESVVIRVLDDRKVITDLTELGLQEQALRDFTEAIEKPQGMIILTGPTGSGKSTTLVAALHHVMDPSKNVITVEEPVEYLISGARQVKLNPKLNFDQALRSILRHDPDIVMVGEMRDLKSAEIAITLANTGHLTFSTLHTNDAVAAVARLYMLGVEPFLIANAINLVMAQRLVRRLCPHCKTVDDNLDPQIALRIGFEPEEIETTKFYRAVGCSECYAGYRGRVAIMEAMKFTREIRRLILGARDEIDDDALRDLAVENGMLTLRASGRERIKEGITTIDEVVAATVET